MPHATTYTQSLEPHGGSAQRNSILQGFCQAGLENPQLKEVRKSAGLLLFRALSSGSLVVVPGVSHR